ncbi:hypothetical protein M8J77_017913 [Diaphorina citri]|nr:hypothetical protein M8J77_017913 [Diaphorina citri]
MGLENKPSSGEDSIPMTIIKKSIPFLAEPLSYIFNTSFATSTFPKLFKTSIIIPIHKKGAKTDVNNFRPISLLNNFSKVLEKIVALRCSRQETSGTIFSFFSSLYLFNPIIPPYLSNPINHSIITLYLFNPINHSIITLYLFNPINHSIITLYLFNPIYHSAITLYLFNPINYYIITLYLFNPINHSIITLYLSNPIYHSAITLYLFNPINYYIITLYLFNPINHYIITLYLFNPINHSIITLYLFNPINHSIITLYLFNPINHYIITLYLFNPINHYIITLYLFNPINHSIITLYLFNPINHPIITLNLFNPINHSAITLYLFNTINHSIITLYLSNPINHYIISFHLFNPINHYIISFYLFNPINFSIFLLYLFNPSDSSAHFTLFADDTTILVGARTEEEVIRRAGEVVGNVVRWFRANKLILNGTKTSYLLFNPKPSSIPQPIVTPEITISIAAEARFLGLTLDYKLMWCSHITDLKPKLSSAIYAIRSVRNNVDSAAAKLSYHSYFHSIMGYALIYWGFSSNVDEVFLLQKRAVRAVFGVGNRTSCKPYFINHSILTIYAQLILDACTLIHKMYPTLTKHSDVHLHNTRHKDNLVTTKNKLMDKSYLKLGIEIYNKLPLELRQTRDVHRIDCTLSTDSFQASRKHQTPNPFNTKPWLFFHLSSVEEMTRNYDERKRTKKRRKKKKQKKLKEKKTKEMMKKEKKKKIKKRKNKMMMKKK